MRCAMVPGVYSSRIPVGGAESLISPSGAEYESVGKVTPCFTIRPSILQVKQDPMVKTFSGFEKSRVNLDVNREKRQPSAARSSSCAGKFRFLRLNPLLSMTSRNSAESFCINRPFLLRRLLCSVLRGWRPAQDGATSRLGLIQPAARAELRRSLEFGRAAFLGFAGKREE